LVISVVLAGGLLAVPARGALVNRIRAGTHTGFSRVVFELTAPFRFTIKSSARQVRIVFPGSRLAGRIPRGRWSDARIRRLVRAGDSTVVMLLGPGKYRVRRFTLTRPHRLVVDVIADQKKAAAPKPPKPPKPPAPAASPARAGPAAPAVPEAKAKPAALQDKKPPAPKKKTPDWIVLKSIDLVSRRGLSRLILTLSARPVSRMRREDDRVILTLRGVRQAQGVDVSGLGDVLVPGVSVEDNRRGTVRVRLSLKQKGLSLDHSYVPSENKLIVDVMRAGAAVVRPPIRAAAKPIPWPAPRLGRAPRPGLWPVFPSVVAVAASRSLASTRTGPTPGPPKAAPVAPIVQKPSPAPIKLPPGPAADLVKKAKDAIRVELPQRAYLLFERARAMIKKKDPQGFQRNPVFREATFGRAEAFWLMHRNNRNLPLIAPRVAEKFQEVLNRYPKSPRYAWALIMLGRLYQATGDRHEALGYYELVIREHAASVYAPLAYLGRARILIQQQRQDEAIKVFQKAISLYPRSRYLQGAYWGLGKTMLDLGRYDYARSVFLTMLKKWPGIYLKRPEILYYLGESYFLLRQYAQARHYLYWVLNIKPNLAYNHIALARIGDTYQFQKQAEAAKQIYRRVIALYPGRDGAIISRIRLIEMGVGGDPVKAYGRLMKRYSQREVAQLAQLKLGAYYFGRKRFSRAESTLNDLLKRHPKSRFKEAALFVLNKVLHERVLALAKAKKHRALIDFIQKNKKSLSPTRRRTYMYLEARSHLALHHYDQAYHLYRRLFIYGDLSRGVVLGLVRSSLGRSDYPRALAAIDEYLRRFGNKPPAEELAFRRAFIWNRLGQKDKAFAALARALARYPLSRWRGRALAEQGLILVSQDRCPAALDYLEKAARTLSAGGRGPRGERLHLLYLIRSDLGSCYFKTGRYSAAIKATRAAIKLSRDKGVRWRLSYRLVECYMKLGLPESAEAVLKQIAKGGDPFWAKLARQRLAERGLWQRARQLGIDARPPGGAGPEAR
jgi:tetratricopeptide (TPR) repeat protein